MMAAAAAAATGLVRFTALHPTASLLLVRRGIGSSQAALNLRSLRSVRNRATAASSAAPAVVAASATESSSSSGAQFPRPKTIAFDQSLANRIHLIGSVGVNPDIQYLDSGNIVATSSLSVKRTAQGEPTWFFLEFQSDLAEVAAQHVRKGNRIHVSGRVVVDSVPVDGGESSSQSHSQMLVKVDVTELHFVDDTYGAQATPRPAVAAAAAATPASSTQKVPGTREEKLQAAVTAWQEFFANPEDWYDNRESKRNPRAPDFKNKTTREGLWIDGYYTPSFVVAQLAELESKGVLKKLEADAAAPPAASTDTKQKSIDAFSPY